MPTKADRYVGAFRQWLSRHGGNGVPYVTGSTLPPLVTKREDLLDRYHSVSQDFDSTTLCSLILHDPSITATANFHINHST